MNTMSFFKMSADVQEPEAWMSATEQCSPVRKLVPLEPSSKDAEGELPVLRGGSVG
jgi:hypothetical protein